jgi:hypothetical protein
MTKGDSQDAGVGFDEGVEDDGLVLNVDGDLVAVAAKGNWRDGALFRELGLVDPDAELHEDLFLDFLYFLALIGSHLGTSCFNARWQKTGAKVAFPQFRLRRRKSRRVHAKF